mmetsp:Transcript_22283/g.44649  ORF Transcript_22283/g.44649 Transcript_22283/m.44649 type:complete len:101 (-) Transcript_22283:416-718(-)
MDESTFLCSVESVESIISAVSVSEAAYALLLEEETTIAVRNTTGRKCVIKKAITFRLLRGNGRMLIGCGCVWDGGVRRGSIDVMQHKENVMLSNHDQGTQ